MNGQPSARACCNRLSKLGSTVKISNPCIGIRRKSKRVEREATEKTIEKLLADQNQYRRENFWAGLLQVDPRVGGWPPALPLEQKTRDQCRSLSGEKEQARCVVASANPGA